MFGCRIISLHTCIQTLHTCIQTIADRKTFCCDRLQSIVFLNVKTTACGRHLKWLKRENKFACSKSFFSVSAIGCSIRIWVAYGDLSPSKFLPCLLRDVSKDQSSLGGCFFAAKPSVWTASKMCVEWRVSSEFKQLHYHVLRKLSNKKSSKVCSRVVLKADFFPSVLLLCCRWLEEVRLMCRVREGSENWKLLMKKKHC